MAQPITLTSEGLLLNWLKNVGDSVKAGEVIAELEADKATIEITAPTDGVLLSRDVEVGEELAEGAVIGQIGASGEPSAAAESAPVSESPRAEAPTESVSQSAATLENGRVKASPLARNIADERGINLAQVPGSGPGGRVTKADVENFTPSSVAASSPASAPRQPARAAGDGIFNRTGSPTWGNLPQEDVEIEDINRMRKAIAEGTITSFTNTPHFYVHREMALDALLALRKQVNDQLVDEGVKVSVNDMLVKGIALALRHFPNLNSHFYGDKIVRHKRIHIGISVALPNNGLVNVVALDADKRSLSDLAVQNKAMFDRARDGKIKPEDVKGATFSISNLGPYDVDWFSAIISSPEAGMLAVGAGKKKPVVLDDGTLGVATIMGATLSIDHRVSDGAEGAQFMQELKTIVENPMRLLV